ncbi:MAG: hypothetical protein KGJ06_09205, partial [Pseudomonadota bacterium]|nr:hypothetical protein [Pseudomonadota bacterium]
MKPALLSCLLIALFCFCLPRPAYAQLDIDTCATNYAGVPNPVLLSFPGVPSFGTSDFTSKVVFCVQNAVIEAVYNVLASLSYYMATTVGAMFTLALIALGMLLIGHEEQLMQKFIGIALRLGIVFAFSASLGAWWFPYPGGLPHAI